MPTAAPHGPNGHGYIQVDLVGNKDQGEALLVARIGQATASQAIIRTVSRMQGGGHAANAKGDRVFILAEAANPAAGKGAAAAHTQIQNLENSIAGDAAHYGLAQHWCCYSDMP